MTNKHYTNKLIILILYLNITVIYGSLKISKIEMRPPKEKDIGLIFDIIILNSLNKERTTLDLRVRGEKCCLELMSENETFCTGPKLFGGYFGKIEPGKTVTVSAIWPTSILFNRKGNCDVTISSSLNASVSNAISDKIYFDTNINVKKIPTIMKLFVNERNITDCCTIDLNPFQNCTPLDCEEKYFGQRNFYNDQKKLCEIVPKCIGENIIYNYINNECVDVNKLVTDEDIELFRSGHISNKIWDLKREIIDENSPGYTDSEFLNPTLDGVRWWTAMDALIIATATLIFYLSICFFIFICFNLITNRRNRNKYINIPPPKKSFWKSKSPDSSKGSKSPKSSKGSKSPNSSKGSKSPKSSKGSKLCFSSKSD